MSHKIFEVNYTTADENFMVNSIWQLKNKNMQMKNILRFFSLMLCTAIVLAGCDKKDSIPFYKNGTAPVLTSDITSFTSTAADSDNVAINFSWTSPGYAADSASVKYIVQIDSAGKDFSNAYSLTVTGVTDTSFTAKQFNAVLLGFGFDFGVAYSVDMRVVSSYANNNDQKISNVVTISATPYKIPPKVALPSSGELYIVGSATQGGWDNPVPVPSQKFTQVDETTWVGVFNLSGGNEYVMLPVNGDWGHKYSVADKTVSGLNGGGDFGYDLSDNIPGPATSGWYKITVDFQQGKFKVEPYNGTVPNELFIVGGATPGGWNNPVPVPGQQFTKLSSNMFELTLPLTGGQTYLFLPTNGSWDHKYAKDDGDATGGTFQADSGSDLPGPATDGSYKISVDFSTNTYKVIKQ